MGVPMDHTPLVMRVAGIPGIGRITARLPVSRASAKMMLRQVGLKGAIDSGKFNAVMIDWFVALLRYTPTLLNEIRATRTVITPIKGLNQEMLFSDELMSRVASPVYCFWGEDDPNGGAETAKQFVSRLSHRTLELVPDAGHAPWIDEAVISGTGGNIDAGVSELINGDVLRGRPDRGCAVDPSWLRTRSRLYVLVQACTLGSCRRCQSAKRGPLSPRSSTACSPVRK